MSILDEGVFARVELGRTREDAGDALALARHVEREAGLTFQGLAFARDLLPLQACDEIPWRGRPPSGVRQA